jgi:hypothetical protein
MTSDGNSIRSNVYLFRQVSRGYGAETGRSQDAEQEDVKCEKFGMDGTRKESR